jgi:hypothetical protein
MTKNERAVQLRDLALRVIKARGTWPSFGGGPRLLTFNDVGLSGLSISYRTPFQRLPPPPEFLKYLAARDGKTASKNLPYGLDVWQDRKVLNVEWSDNGRVDVVATRPERGNTS